MDSTNRKKFIIFLTVIRYTQIIQKHSMFFIILMTKVFYLIASVAVFWTTDQMFQLGSYSTYGYDWIVSLYPVSECHLDLGSRLNIGIVTILNLS